MKKAKYLFRFILFIAFVVSYGVGAMAQGRFGGRGGGRASGFYHSGLYGGSSRNFIAMGTGGRYHSNYYSAYHPYYRAPYAFTHFGPSFGFRINVLPIGYSPFYLGSNPYYYYNGIYYRPYNDGGYEVTAPPLGASVKKLPSGATVTVINGQKFYELGGTFYQEQITSKNKIQYLVVGTNGVIDTLEQEQIQDQQQPLTAPVQHNNMQQEVPALKMNQLPANSKVVVINQQKYFMAPSGVYYQESIDANNNVSYQVVGSSDSNGY